jgi:hypothetical protein
LWWPSDSSSSTLRFNARSEISIFINELVAISSVSP